MLEINHRLATIQGAFVVVTIVIIIIIIIIILKAAFSKNDYCSGVCFNLTYSHHSPQLLISLEDQQSQVIVRTSSLAASGWGRIGLNLPRNAILKELLLFDLSGNSLETSIHSTYLSLI